ncbi:MAG TPA: type II and III secretion system protein family protein, partial [Lacipirellulaceae bacterium]|nr:type II and III secretion system protein family protein [Lacipirellulaceae bacterium]
PPAPIAAPTPPAAAGATARTAQMTRPPLDTSPGTGPAPAMAAGPAPRPANAANTLSGGAIFTGTTGRDLNIEINRGALIRLQAAADTVFVANPDIADIQVKSPRMIYIYGKKAGETVLYAVDGDDEILMNTRVNVTHNLAASRTALRSAAPTSGLDIATVGDALVISGDVPPAVQAENVRRLAARFAPGEGAVVNNMRVTAPNQINLRVRIAEVAREDLKQFGINWDAALNVGGFAFGLFTGNPVVLGAFIPGGAHNISRRANDFNNLFAGRQGNRFDVNGLIDALANENLITVLAEPNLTAMSGETANFLAGGEFPIPVAQSGNNSGITIEFKKFGVGLAFTPTVLDDGRINLRVRPEVSQLSSVGQIVSNGISIPALTTRRAETTVELGSGQSFAIAGLLQNNSTQDVNKVPFLGDVPILGALFKSDRYRRNETELVIVVTPYLVKPVSSNAIATPVDGFVPPTDGQRILYGSTHQQGMPEGTRVTRGPDGNALIGPAGFQLD